MIGDRPVDPYAWHYRPKPAALLNYHKIRHRQANLAACEDVGYFITLCAFSALLTVLFLT